MGFQYLFSGISKCWSSLVRHRLSNVSRLRNLSEVTPREILSHPSHPPSPSSTCTGMSNGHLYSRIRVAYSLGREGAIWATDTLCFGLLSIRSRVNTQKRYFHVMKKLHQQVPLSRPLSTSTAVAKDVILFEHDRTRFFRLLAVFCGGQFLFWTYLAHFAFTGLRDTGGSGSGGRHVSTTGLAGLWSFDMNLGSNAWRYGFTLACLVIGMWHYSVRIECAEDWQYYELGHLYLCDCINTFLSLRWRDHGTWCSVLPAFCQPGDST